MTQNDAVEPPFLNALHHDPARAIVLGWWRNLNDLDENGERRRGGGGWRAARATLRRADGLTAVMAEPAFGDVIARLSRRHRLTADTVERLALVAAVLVHVTENTPGRGGFAAQLAAAREGSDQPVFSVSRLKALIGTDEPEAAARTFRRAVTILGGTADVIALARALFTWTTDETRRDLAFRYFQARASAKAEDVAA